MPRQHISGRTIAEQRHDTKRNLSDKSVQFLRVYIGRIAVRMMLAEELIEAKDGFPAISPTAQTILRLLEPLSLEEDEA